jgi:type IV pilus assembly protein PilC
MKWEDELAAQTQRVVLYPLFVGAVVALVTVFLMIYLVPQMAGFMRNLGQEIPLQTRILIQVSALFVDYWWVIIALPLAAGFGVKAAARANPALGYALDRYQLALPLVGSILRKIIVSASLRASR